MINLNNIKTGTRFFITFAMIIAVSLVGFIYNSISITHITDDVTSIYSVRMKGIDFLIEADRDAYQSSIAISQALNRSDDGKMSERVESVKENREQVKTRFDSFQKLYEQTGAAKTEEFGIFNANYLKWTEISGTIQLNSGSGSRTETLRGSLINSTIRPVGAVPPGFPGSPGKTDSIKARSSTFIISRVSY